MGRDDDNSTQAASSPLSLTNVKFRAWGLGLGGLVL